jgi:hypothetical protein
MTPDILEKNLLLYGADFSRWPAAEAAAAQRLLASDIAAQALFDDIARLDGTLKRAVAPAPTDSALTGRILEAAHARLPAPLFPAPWRLAATGLAVAASIAGFAVGYFEGAGTVPLDGAGVMALGETEMESGVADMWLLL